MEIQGWLVSLGRQSLSTRARPYITNASLGPHLGERSF